MAQERPDGKLHPIAYAGRTTQGAEKNYASSELEALAVLWATRHFKHYVYGVKCVVYRQYRLEEFIVCATSI